MSEILGYINNYKNIALREINSVSEVWVNTLNESPFVQFLCKTNTIDLQNLSVFCISILSFLSCMYYKNYDVTSHYVGQGFAFDTLMPLIGTHAIVDFFVTKTYDVKFHHLCVLGFLYYNYSNRVSSQDGLLLTYSLIKTELSSFFYVLKYYLPKNSFLYTMNSIFFYIGFLKLRIFDYYGGVIHNHSAMNLLIQKYSQTNTVSTFILVSSCYGLYILNLYWFLIINKVVYKNLIKFLNINTDQLCHYLCSYTQLLNIPMCFFIYSYNKNEKYLFDVIGVSLLSVNSYLYHYDIYKRLNTNLITEYNYPYKENVVFYLHDSVSIHIRSFLTVVTSFYHNEKYLFFVFVSGVTHLSSIYSVILNLIVLLIRPDDIKDDFFHISKIITILPIALDILFVFFNSSNEIAVPFLTVNILIALLLMVDPFYKLTHFAFHILLIIQNYYLCLSHSSSSVV